MGKRTLEKLEKIWSTLKDRKSHWCGHMPLLWIEGPGVEMFTGRVLFPERRGWSCPCGKAGKGSVPRRHFPVYGRINPKVWAQWKKYKNSEPNP